MSSMPQAAAAAATLTNNNFHNRAVPVVALQNNPPSTSSNFSFNGKLYTKLGDHFHQSSANIKKVKH